MKPYVLPLHIGQNGMNPPTTEEYKKQLEYGNMRILTSPFQLFLQKQAELEREKKVEVKVPNLCQS